MSGPAVDVYFDYVSSFSWYLSHRLDFAAQFAGARLVWKPIRLEGLSSDAGGMPYSPQGRRYVVLDGIRSQEIADRAASLLAEVEAEARGVFGVPTLALEDELFWGNDRLEMLRWRLGRH